jgi:hypothetical protein
MSFLYAMCCIGSCVTVGTRSVADESSSAEEEEETEVEESMLSEEATAASEGDSEVEAPTSSDWEMRKAKTKSERKLLHERFSGLSLISSVVRQE